METFLKADIFFTITTITVVAVALIAIVALVYIILILNELRHLMRRVRKEGEQIVDDISSIRETVEQQGWRTKEFVDSIGYSVIKIFKMFTSDQQDDSKGKKK